MSLAMAVCFHKADSILSGCIIWMTSCFWLQCELVILLLIKRIIVGKICGGKKVLETAGNENSFALLLDVANLVTACLVVLFL